MLSLKNIDDFMMKIGVDFNSSVSTKDTFGDLITAVDPDCDFSLVKKSIIKNINVNKKIVNQGLNFVEIFDCLWIDGDRINTAMFISAGSGGSGTSAKIMVKSIDTFANGKVRKFLSFESLSEYKAMIQN